MEPFHNIPQYSYFKILIPTPLHMHTVQRDMERKELVQQCENGSSYLADKPLQMFRTGGAKHVYHTVRIILQYIPSYSHPLFYAL